jgi:hypothetical protein
MRCREKKRVAPRSFHQFYKTKLCQKLRLTQRPYPPLIFTTTKQLLSTVQVCGVSNEQAHTAI